MEIFIFIVLTILSAIVSAAILFVKGGPGIVGICGAGIPLVLGIPAAIFVFFHPTFKKKFKDIRGAIFPALIPVMLASIALGLLVHDQNPKVMFKRLLSNPIPDGISNIRSYDNSGGFDVEYGLAFEATPEAIDYLIATNGFEPNTDDFNSIMLDAPFKYFPDVNQNQDWLYYSKEDRENEEVWGMWVNQDKNFVLFKFIGY